ncbi:unnamed protein product, partial [Staurois parvus]
FSGHVLVTKDGEKVDPEEALQNKIVGLFFSAAWCSPCRDFTPVLCDFYSELVEEADPPAQFEIVFISSDKSAEDMVDYMHDIAWRMAGSTLAQSIQTVSFLAPG